MIAPRPVPLKAGFTLVELLAVIALIAILTAASVPAVSSMMQSNNLLQAGQMVADQFAQARQMASVRNRTVEVRLINLPGVSAKGFQALQLWVYDTSGNATVASKLQPLPAGVGVSDNSSISAMLSTRTNPMCFSSTMPTGIVGGPTSGSAYVALRVRPTGEVEPVPASADRAYLYLTVLSSRLITASTSALPTNANYIVEQINPDTSNVQIYRP